MDHIRWSYIRKIRQMALQQGFVLAKMEAVGHGIIPDEFPVFELRQPGGKPSGGIADAEWECHDDDACLYTLVDQVTNASAFKDGVTIGQVEDFLINNPRNSPPKPAAPSDT